MMFISINVSIPFFHSSLLDHFNSTTFGRNERWTAIPLSDEIAVWILATCHFLECKYKQNEKSWWKAKRTSKYPILRELMEMIVCYKQIDMQIRGIALGDVHLCSRPSLSRICVFLYRTITTPTDTIVQGTQKHTHIFTSRPAGQWNLSSEFWDITRHLPFLWNPACLNSIALSSRLCRNTADG